MALAKRTFLCPPTYTSLGHTRLSFSHYTTNIDFEFQNKRSYHVTIPSWAKLKLLQLLQQTVTRFIKQGNPFPLSSFSTGLSTSKQDKRVYVFFYCVYGLHSFRFIIHIHPCNEPTPCKLTVSIHEKRKIKYTIGGRCHDRQLFSNRQDFVHTPTQYCTTKSEFSTRKQKEFTQTTNINPKLVLIRLNYSVNVSTINK